MSNRWRGEMTAAWPAARALLKSAKRSIAQPDSFDKSFFSSSDGSLFSSSDGSFFGLFSAVWGQGFSVSDLTFYPDLL